MSAALCFASLALVGVDGCDSQPAAPAHRTEFVYDSSGPAPLQQPMPTAPTGPTMSADQAVNSDPTAVRLQDIEGILLEYYALNRRLPNSLEDARSMAEADAPADVFTAPSTHAPFSYTAAGLGSGGSPKRIIVYESVPHAGQRWCILMPPATAVRPGSMSMEVIALPEAAFHKFKP